MVDTPSFLREELEAFEKIYTELLSAPPTRRPSLEDKRLDSPADDLQRLTDLAVALDNVRFVSYRSSDDPIFPTEPPDDEPGDPPDQTNSSEVDVIELDTDEMDLTRFFRSKSKRGSKHRIKNPFHAGFGTKTIGRAAGDTIRGIYGLDQNEQASPTASPPPPASAPDTPEPSVSALSLRRSRIGTGDKLFLDLLDDLDRISGNTPSSRRRKKARDLFAEWLFSQNPSVSSPSSNDIERKKLNRKSFHEYASHVGVHLDHPDHLRERRNSDSSKDQLVWHPRSKSCIEFNEVSDDVPTCMCIDRCRHWFSSQIASTLAITSVANWSR